jgi:hypothetical protein
MKINTKGVWHGLRKMAVERFEHHRIGLDFGGEHECECGTKIIVTRTVERGGRHEIGQRSSYKEQSLTFTLPATGQRVIWEDHYSEEVGGANFLPMLIDIFRGTPYLVVSPMGCLSHNKWGKPNPPYVVFKYHDKEWKRILLQDMPNEIATPNLIFSAPDIAVEKFGKNFVAAEVIQKIISGYRQPEYKIILREPLANEKCPQYSGGAKAPIPVIPGTSLK